MTQPTPEGDRPRKGARSTAGAPRWVKVLGIVVAVLVALFVIVQLTGLGEAMAPVDTSCRAYRAPPAFRSCSSRRTAHESQ